MVFAVCRGGFNEAPVTMSGCVFWPESDSVKQTVFVPLQSLVSWWLAAWTCDILSVGVTDEQLNGVIDWPEEVIVFAERTADIQTPACCRGDVRVSVRLHQ